MPKFIISKRNTVTTTWDTNDKNIKYFDTYAECRNHIKSLGLKYSGGSSFMNRAFSFGR